MGHTTSAARARNGRHRLLRSSVIPFAALAACPALAQVSAQSATAPTGVSELVVTAQRREELLHDVPVAVSAVSGQQLMERNFHDLQQLQYAVPSLQANARSAAPGVADYFIRGVGTGVFSNAIEYDVSNVIDDVVLGRPELGSLQYFDVERIEVLRGPQATLFGKNASAGVVSVVTKRPKIGVTEGGLTAEAAAVGTPDTGFSGRVEGVVNIPVSANSALRISGFGTYQSPLVDNVLPNNQSDFAFREGGAKIKYLWRPNDRFHLYAIADYAREKGVGTGAFTLRAAGATAPFPPALAASLAASHIVPGPDNTRNNANAPYNSHFQVGGAQAEAGYDFENGYSLSNILAWRFYGLAGTADSDLTSVNYFDQVATQLKDSQFSNELRLSSPAGGVVEGQGGVYLYRGRFVRNSQVYATLGNTSLPPGRGARGGSTASTQHADSAAIFAQFTVRVASNVRLIAGARYTYDDIRLDAQSVLGNNVTPFFPVGNLQQTRTQANISYKLGVQYDLSPNDMAYASYTRGYKGPAFNNTTSTIAAVRVDPEIPEAAEIGLKSALFDGRLTMNLAAFYEVFHNYQTTSLDPLIGQTVLQNAGEARSKGFEAEFTAKPTAELTLTGGLAYVDAKVANFPNAPCYFGQTVAQGCVVIRPASLGAPALTTFDASGQPLVQAPKFTINGTIRYKRSLTPTVDGFATVSGYYRTKSNFSINGDPNTALAAYGLVDADIGVGSADDRWRVSLYAHNLFDKRVPTYLQGLVAAAGSYQQIFNSSSFRMIGVTTTLRF